MTENKNEGKIKVLEMLSEGKITTAEALELLKQFPEEEERQGYDRIDPRQINPNKVHHTYETEREPEGLGHKINEGIKDVLGVDFADIGNSIRENLEDLGDLDINLDLADIFVGHGYQSSITYVSDPIGQNIAALRLLGKNAKVEVVGCDGNQLRITCKFKAKRPDAQVFVNEDKGSYEVLYDYNAMRSMQIYCEVPRVLVEEIHAETKNDKVEMWRINARHIDLLTKNAAIKIGDIQAKEIIAKTGNDNIYAERIKAREIALQTSNAKIAIERITADIARLTTTNSKVVTEGSDIKHLFVKTTNAGIKLENIFKALGPDAWGGERTIDAYTTNGGVTMYIPRDVAATVQASTSNGRIDCDLHHMLAGEMSKNYINGRSQSYDTSAKKVKVGIRTTNATIKIKEE
ncbi:MAG: DUF4097 domain-containing protein [Defluviitaleaceae bacterium]|nr:DUF4097 domain-containing protein [Defluviitaleaceae bacterium]